MNFEELIKGKMSALKTTKTLIKHADGSSYIEDSDMRRLGLNPTRITVTPIGYGYIVDNTPDCIPSEVFPGLFIGSQDCAEIHVLTAHNIINVLSIGIPCQIDDIPKLFIPCLDLPDTDIYPILRQACNYIKTILTNKQSVLVHCNAGISRASMVVIGYLIVEQKKTYTEAFDMVKSKRHCIKPNVGFVKQLCNIQTKMDLYDL